LGAMIFQILFASVFYTADARYLVHIIPSLLIGVAFSMFFLLKIFEKYNIKMALPFVVIFTFIIYSFVKFDSLKKQVAINLRYSEVPWYYISVLRLNEYFYEVDDKPFVITTLTPHFVDFYSNGNYELLPLTDQGAFWKQRKIVYGNYDYSDLVDLYSNLIENGEEVYFSSYGLANKGYLHAAFNRIKENFEVEQVYAGCYTQCNIYRLKLKDV
jgi:hypothetical protein